MARKRDDALTRPHDIHSLLDQYDDGTVLDEINADIRSVTQAVARTGGKGEVTLTLKVSGGGDKRLKVAMSSKAKVPRFGHGPREVYLHARRLALTDAARPRGAADQRSTADSRPTDRGTRPIT